MLVVKFRYLLFIILLIPIFFFPFVLNSSVIVMFLLSALGAVGLGYKSIDYYFILSKKYHGFLNKKQQMTLTVTTKKGQRLIQGRYLNELYRFKIANTIRMGLAIKHCVFLFVYYGVPIVIYFLDISI